MDKVKVGDYLRHVKSSFVQSLLVLEKRFLGHLLYKLLRAVNSIEIRKKCNFFLISMEFVAFNSLYKNDFLIMSIAPRNIENLSF